MKKINIFKFLVLILLLSLIPIKTLAQENLTKETYINDYANILEDYEETYYCPEIKNYKRNSYVIRNRYMIDKSDICVFYYAGIELMLKPATKKQPSHIVHSGTKLALDYAEAKNKDIINIYNFN